MNLIKQLPLGLGLACFMFMSSCSKEEAVTPGSAVTNESSNLRQGGPVFVPIYHFPSTNGPTCVGCMPGKWHLGKTKLDATSSLTAYAGNPSKKWVQPLPTPSTGSGSIVTMVGEKSYYGYVSANAENLIPGKKYKLTFSISRTALNEANGTGPYAATADLHVRDVNSNNIITEKVIDFNGKKNEWVTETIEFIATFHKQEFDFHSENPQGESKLTYTNIHVGENAVQQLN
ncbi:hypothetical protein [Dyadobacter sp. CY326]|uniref:hypothetical protein n=1 Tax=Dyadobacter sp. CY326 TaxID=2907300 RepID=UPI001F1BA25D|nr:hypothetical protein [Dyadobacter sp. CY326]MCE7067345.1 hypothetical protein [Dyadobacter sp. CY326]